MSASGVPRARRHPFAALDLGEDKLTRVGDWAKANIVEFACRPSSLGSPSPDT
ncbi:hypothetical protein ACFXDI_27580 [Streptomyces mirabilis]|jgi:hypothetical protein|uniref:hypothetical protein n=1 Tax=Streptomyces mirabilis TaxID=68239 RepID=UPI0036B1104E